MNGLRISELAERVAVSPSTVRYYERIGLVPPPDRSASGYRLYGADAEARLLFISRGKRLGLNLAEIADLLDIWDGTNCGPTQERLSALLAAKQVEVRRQIEELEVSDRVRRLMAQEQECCAFLSFRFEPEGDRWCWTIEAPDVEAAPALDEFLPLLSRCGGPKS